MPVSYTHLDVYKRQPKVEHNNDIHPLASSNDDINPLAGRR